MIAKYVKERHVLTLRGGGAQDDRRGRRRGCVSRIAASIKEGNWADVTIFDLDTLQDRATYEKPMEFPTGIE